MTFYKFFVLMFGSIALLSAVGVGAEKETTGEVVAKGSKSNATVEQVGEQCDGFTLTTAFDKAVFTDGEPIKVAIRLKNLRATEDRLQSKDTEFVLKVTNANGITVPLTEYGKQKYLYPRVGSSATINLKPNEEIAGLLLVNRIYDLTWSGQYNVTVLCRVPAPGDLARETLVISKTSSITIEFNEPVRTHQTPTP